jgi:hypothetical protein
MRVKNTGIFSCITVGLRQLERAFKARHWEVVNGLIWVGVGLWHTEQGRAGPRHSCTSFGPPPPRQPKTSRDEAGSWFHKCDLMSHL